MQDPVASIVLATRNVPPRRQLHRPRRNDLGSRRRRRALLQPLVHPVVSYSRRRCSAV